MKSVQPPPLKFTLKPIPDPLTMQEIEFFETGQVKRIVYRPYAEVLRALQSDHRGLAPLLAESQELAA